APPDFPRMDRLESGEELEHLRERPEGSLAFADPRIFMDERAIPIAEPFLVVHAHSDCLVPQLSELVPGHDAWAEGVRPILPRSRPHAGARVRATWARNARKSRNSRGAIGEWIRTSPGRNAHSGASDSIFSASASTWSDRSHTSPFNPGHASTNSSVSAGMAESTADRSTIFSQWSHRPRTAPRRGGPPAVENRTSLMAASALLVARTKSETAGTSRFHLGSSGGRFPAFARGLHPCDVLRPAQDICGITVREALGRDPHALEVRIEHDRKAR